MRGGDVLASVECASSVLTRLRATVELDHADRVLWCAGSRIAHSIGARSSLDAAYLDHDLVVLALTSLSPLRVGRPRRGAAGVVEAPQGTFDRWGLKVGDQLEVRA